MQRLEVSGAVRPIYGSLGVKRLQFAILNFTTIPSPLLEMLQAHVNKRKGPTVVADLRIDFCLIFFLS